MALPGNAGSRGRLPPPRRCPSKPCFRTYGGSMDTVSIDIHSLHSLLGSAAAPLVLDVRREPAFAADARMVAGALRLADLAAALPARPVVAYCVHGHEVSQEAAARLRERGLDARYLEGGIEAWKAQRLPTMR